MNTHPQVAWVQWWRTPTGIVTRCTVCAAHQGSLTPQEADAFAAAHAEHQRAPSSHLGLGDVVARATGALGVKPCAPCKKRQEQLNGLFPRVWKR